MSSIIYRVLSSTNDYTFGLGTAQGFLVDIPAVAQAIQTSLLLFLGEWWLDLSVGLPLWQNILGTRNSEQNIILLIQNVILSVPFVQAVTNVVTNYNASTRAFTFTATVTTTIGGTITVSNVPINLPPVSIPTNLTTLTY